MKTNTMKEIKAYAADSKDADLKPFEIERRLLGKY